LAYLLHAVETDFSFGLGQSSIEEDICDADAVSLEIIENAKNPLIDFGVSRWQNERSGSVDTIPCQQLIIHIIHQ
jgi:hypothetical protein